MPPIQTLDEAVRVADEFLKRWYYFRKLRKVQREGNTRLVDFDVGIMKVDIIHIGIDANSGTVTKYTQLESQ